LVAMVGAGGGAVIEAGMMMQGWMFVGLEWGTVVVKSG